MTNKLLKDYDWTQHTALIDITIRKQGVNDFEDRRELVQDTLVKLLSKTWVDDAPKGLAYRIAMQIAIDYLRTKHNRARLLQKYHSIGTEYGSNSSARVGKGVSQGRLEPIAKGLNPEHRALVYDQVSKVLNTLSVPQSEAILLVDVLGYTYQEGADQAGISKQSFYRRHQRGLVNIAKAKAHLDDVA